MENKTLMWIGLGAAAIGAAYYFGKKGTAAASTSANKAQTASSPAPALPPASKLPTSPALPTLPTSPALPLPTSSTLPTSPLPTSPGDGGVLGTMLSQAGNYGQTAQISADQAAADAVKKASDLASQMAGYSTAPA